jgi:hypothetical protein
MKILDMKMQLVTEIVAVIGLTVAPALLAQGCCGGGAMKGDCSMGGMGGADGHAGHVPTAATTDAAPIKPVFAQPVQPVFDHYVQVQVALVENSLQGLSTAGSAMAKTVQADPGHTLPAKVAGQAEALGKAKDLATARAAFKSLSDSLIDYLKGQKAAAGTYHVAYCPMAKASWIQIGTTVMNPYMGRSMPHCGQIQN